MKLPIILSAMSLTVLPSIASVIRPRDAVNNVFVGYYDGDSFVTRTVELKRKGDTMIGGLRLQDRKSTASSRSSSSSSFPSIPSSDDRSKTHNIYYAEIIQGPEKVACRFTRNPMIDGFLQSDLAPDEMGLTLFAPGRPFVPYEGHITDAVNIVCGVSVGGQQDQERESELPSSSSSSSSSGRGSPEKRPIYKQIELDMLEDAEIPWEREYEQVELNIPEDAQTPAERRYQQVDLDIPDDTETPSERRYEQIELDIPDDDQA